MQKITFLAIGAQKSGTTLLYEILKEMDDIYLPDTKELHFFDSPEDFSKGLEWYQSSYFKPLKNYSVSGEITPSYLYLPEVSKRIYDTLDKDLKFIVILRNPIERAYSHYTMRYKKGEEKYAFSDALILESARVKRSLEDKKKYSYLSRGFYSAQIEEYFKYFDKEQFLFMLFDEFVTHQDYWTEEICKFLDVKKTKKIFNKHVHSSQLTISKKLKFSFLNKNYNLLEILKAKSYPKMNKSVRDMLKEVYRDDIKSLEKIINKDLSRWLQ